MEDDTGILNGKESILIVDDEDYIRALLARWLEAEGYHCFGAADTHAAREILLKEDIALVISDIIMPGSSGMELLSYLSSEHQYIAVVMLTAVDDMRVARAALEMGAYGYIVKPFEKHELLICVVGALRRRQLEEENRAYREKLEQKVDEQTREIKQSREQIVYTLLSAAQYKSHETASHVRRIGLYSELMARAMGRGGDFLENVRLAASMHDIGKIGIPDNILQKPGPLEAWEWDVMKEHSSIGYSILADTNIPLLDMAAVIALEHHERWDGNGYPHGKKCLQICEPARIVAVADVYDAVTHRRVYKRAWSEEEALELLLKEKEGHFDPFIVDLFMDNLPEIERIKRENQE